VDVLLEARTDFFSHVQAHMKRNPFWPLIIHPPVVNTGTHEKKSVLASNNTSTNGEPRHT
jgi:hypothetical protein